MDTDKTDKTDNNHDSHEQNPGFCVFCGSNDSAVELDGRLFVWIVARVLCIPCISWFKSVLPLGFPA